MNKLLTTLFALAVASVTGLAQAQAPAQKKAPAAAPAASAAARAAGGAKSIEAKVAMCIGCHGIIGYQASFPEVHKVPMIAGQSETYLAAALAAYKGGDRKHPTMRAIADSLNEQDIADIAAYYSRLGLEEGDAPPATVAKQPSERVQALISR